MVTTNHNEYLRNVLAAQKALTGDPNTLNYLSGYVTQKQLAESNDLINKYLEGGVSEDVYGIDPTYDYSKTTFGMGILGVTAAVLGSFTAIGMIDKTLDFDPIGAAKDAFDNLGKPPDPNQTIGSKFAGSIRESQFSDPNRDPDEVAYGALGTANSYSLPGTSFALGISDKDVLDMTEEEAVGKLEARETFESTNTAADTKDAAEQAANIGRGTDKASAAARGGEGHGQGSKGQAPAGTGSGKGGIGSSGSLSGGMGTAGGYSGTGEGAQAEAQAASGGRIGALIQHLQTGGEAENADTNMEVANVPMGVVSDADGAPSPFSGGTGVEDDLDMEVEAGSYVLNAESVQLIGISDINAVIRDAYSIAAALGKEVPADYDPQNKVPIRISNGEAVIPKALVDIIGLDKLEKWNKKGLQLRKQKEKMMAQQQQQQPPQQQQVASEAPMQQQMGQLMDRGGTVAMSQEEDRDELYKEEEDKFFNVLTGEEDTLTKLRERNEEEGAASGAESIVAPVTSIVKEPVNEPSTETLQKIFRTDDSSPDSVTGKPQPNINKGITVEESSGVEESEDNIMAAQVAKTSVMPKSAFDRMKYTDDYDVVYGHDLYTPKLSKKKITRMTVKEIFANQDRLQKATSKETHTSTAHGPYQILKVTLKSLMKNYKYDINTLFTPAFQDRLATHLLKESGVFKFIKREKDLNTVQDKLANIWAALPVSDEDKESAHKNQKAALTDTEFKDVLKRVQKLGEAKGIPLLLKTIRKAETALR
jgi:hypothetical protein